MNQVVHSLCHNGDTLIQRKDLIIPLTEAVSPTMCLRSPLTNIIRSIPSLQAGKINLKIDPMIQVTAGTMMQVETLNQKVDPMIPFIEAAAVLHIDQMSLKVVPISQHSKTQVKDTTRQA